LFNLPFHIAKRYLISKKSHNVINLVSAISIIGVAIGTMALIVVLSVFNGLEGLVKSLLNSFDPDLKIVATTGKVFSTNSFDIVTLLQHDQVVAYSQVLEENALLEYRDKQQIGKVKGVDEQYRNVTGIDTMLLQGDYILTHGDYDFAIAGYGVAEQLSLMINSHTPIKAWIPKRGKLTDMNPQNAFLVKLVYPAAIFSIQAELDYEYTFVPLRFLKELLEYDTEISAIEIKLTEKLTESQKQRIEDEFQNKLGSNFDVLNRFEQHEFLYKVMKSEKWAIFLILSFILFIASFSIIASLTMLIIEKKEDIYTLQSIGADSNLISKIFLIEGWMISVFGAIIGLLFGVFLCWLQQTYGLIRFPGNGTFVVNHYPVKVLLFDVLLTFITVSLLGFLIAWLPVRYIIKKHSLRSPS